ncbi:MAG: hypothetical protein V2I27_12755 [Erythrobacter sp.]|jgi:hypothetical protein|nr:hypothetical protein [Erythrobacter sp.]
MDGSHETGAHNGLIGHTGFVGSNLARQARFARVYNSRTIEGLGGERFDALVCAAAPGSMFEANRDPAADRAKVHALIEQLDRVEADRFVLVSSIAVLARFDGCDDEGTSAFQTELAYGRHRRELEAFVEDRFADHLIVRLPALFGEGLKKNLVFDLLNPVPSMLPAQKLAVIGEALEPPLAQMLSELYAPGALAGVAMLDRAALARHPRRGVLEAALIAMGQDAIQFHHRDTTYQYYELARLWADIETALAAGLTHLHCATEPLRAADIHQRLTGRPMPETTARLHAENMHTRHAALWGREAPYLADAGEVLERLAVFIEQARMPA